jgi:uncharacterized membrane protein YdjX (TVP38/TMEM64 family)
VARGTARLISLALVLGGLIAGLALSGSLSAESVRDEVDRAGAWAPLVFVLAGSLLTVLLFPGPLTAGASGLLFGTAAGTPITILTLVCGGVLAFSIGRWWAHDAVEELATRRPRLGALRAWVGERGFLSVLYARIAPGVPYNLVNYAAGLAPVRLQAFVAATALGCAPRAFAYTALGGSFGDLGSPEALAAIAVLVAMAVGGLVIAGSARSRSVAAGPGSAADSSTPVGRSAGPR